MSDSVKSIQKLLLGIGYPNSLSPRFVSGPSGKEFYALMQAMFNHLSPNEPLVDKMETSLPEALARVGKSFVLEGTYGCRRRFVKSF